MEWFFANTFSELWGIAIALRQDLTSNLSLFGFLNFVRFPVGVDNCPGRASALIAAALAFIARNEVSANPTNFASEPNVRRMRSLVR
jgi:hypothetical protein